MLLEVHTLTPLESHSHGSPVSKKNKHHDDDDDHDDKRRMFMM